MFIYIHTHTLCSLFETAKNRMADFRPEQSNNEPNQLWLQPQYSSKLVCVCVCGPVFLCVCVTEAHFVEKDNLINACERAEWRKQRKEPLYVWNLEQQLLQSHMHRQGRGGRAEEAGLGRGLWGRDSRRQVFSVKKSEKRSHSSLLLPLLLQSQ